MPERPIVVCDDNELLRWSIVLHLQQRGFRCETAGNGRQLLELLSRVHAQLVLLDLNMPRMGGLEALRRLRGAGSRLPIIVMTGSGEEACDDAQASGATTTIVKPFAPAEVGDLVEQHVALSK